MYICNKDLLILLQNEYVKYFECTYDEALELMDMGYINSANSMLTLEKSKQCIKRR